MSSIENLGGLVTVSIGDIVANAGKIPLEPNKKMTLGGISPKDPTSIVDIITSQSPGSTASSIRQLMELAETMVLWHLTTSKIQPEPFVMSSGGGRCDPDAESFKACEDGLWIEQTGVCICSVICPTFSMMQSCNAHVHWGCLWIEGACYDTTSQAMLSVERNCYCRSGPGLMYPALTSFPVGTKLQVTGSSDAFGAVWWQVRIPGRDDLCWISSMVGQSSLPVEQVPQIPPPATPTPKPQAEEGGGGGVSCNPAASSETECPGGLWNGFYCDCSLLCSGFSTQSTCEAHASWDCKWSGGACIIGSG